MAPSACPLSPGDTGLVQGETRFGRHSCNECKAVAVHTLNHSWASGQVAGSRITVAFGGA